MADAQKTAYHVLRLATPEMLDVTRLEQAETWEIVARDVAANSAEHAIRLHCTEALKGPKADAGGMYVAVPSRSWKTTPVKAETKTILKLTG
jgi:hypothetical protein